MEPLVKWPVERVKLGRQSSLCDFLRISRRKPIRRPWVSNGCGSCWTHESELLLHKAILKLQLPITGWTTSTLEIEPFFNISDGLKSDYGTCVKKTIFTTSWRASGRIAGGLPGFPTQLWHCPQVVPRVVQTTGSVHPQPTLPHR